MVDLVVVGPSPEDDADDAVTTAGAALGRDQLAIGASFDALDLPDVGFHAGLLQRGDRAAHQLGTQLGVIAV